MNVERLHRILLDLNEDLANTKTLNLLGQVTNHLQNQVSEPNQASHQTKLVQVLGTLYASLENAEYNSYSPSWRQSIAEISNDIDFGLELKNKIEGIFTKNAITPAKALADIKGITEELKIFQNAVNEILNGFKLVSIGTEKLNQGECELGYTIPRKYVENKLALLLDEIEELEFILNHFSEAVTGKKQDFDIKTISSSDFILYIILSIYVADALSKALERILNHYKQILEIKDLKNKLSDRGINEDATKLIEEHVNNSMAVEIKKIAKELIEEHYAQDDGRKNELENGVVISLNKLANRIDNGFHVEIRVEPLPSPMKNDEVNEDEQKENDLLVSIKKRSHNIEFIETGGKTILELPEGDLDDNKDK